MGIWIKDTGWVTPGGDPVWICPNCGKAHVYGIEHQDNYRRVCEVCGQENRYPWEPEEDIEENES